MFTHSSQEEGADYLFGFTIKADGKDYHVSLIEAQKELTAENQAVSSFLGAPGGNKCFGGYWGFMCIHWGLYFASLWKEIGNLQIQKLVL